MRRFETFLNDVEGLRDWLAAERVSAVAVEATGSSWKPVWYVLEDLDSVQMLLVNARHVKQVPERKTNVTEAVWLAELLEHGLLAGSFVPPPVSRQLPDLTRYRKRLIQDRTREAQRACATARRSRFGKPETLDKEMWPSLIRVHVRPLWIQQVQKPFKTLELA